MAAFSPSCSRGPQLRKVPRGQPCKVCGAHPGDCDTSATPVLQCEFRGCLWSSLKVCSPPLSVFCCCCYKWPQTWWLEKQKLILSQFWKPNVQNPGARRAIFPLEVPGENLFFASGIFWWLSAFLDLRPRHSNLCLWGHVVFSFPLCLSSECIKSLST